MATANVTITVDLDASEAFAALEAIQPPLELDIDLDRAVEVLAELKCLRANPTQFLVVEPDAVGAARAGNASMTIKPSDRLRKLVATILANKREFKVVDN